MSHVETAELNVTAWKQKIFAGAPQGFWAAKEPGYSIFEPSNISSSNNHYQIVKGSQSDQQHVCPLQYSLMLDKLVVNPLDSLVL
jgi:hypothetical protein